MPTYRLLRVCLLAALSGFWVIVGFPLTASAVGSVTTFRPVSNDELKMTVDSEAPGAPAVILYKEVSRDDNGQTGHEDDYIRIKILTEEGRNYGNVEVPIEYDGEEVLQIHARTIRPDGTIVEFDGKSFTKMAAKGQGIKVRVKAFSLPSVQAGCVIEYYYTIDFPQNIIISPRWTLNDQLLIKSADFTFKPYTNDSYNDWRVSWTWENMPPGTGSPQQDAKGIVHLHVSNVPALVIEDLMPPENELKGRVEFKYSHDTLETDVSKFWANVGRKLDGQMEGYLGKPKSLENIVAGIVAPNDPPEVKLKKIYARVQQLRNTSYEVHKTEAEEKRENEKEPGSAEDAWKKGYANGVDLTWLYLGLVRAAGFEAYGVEVPNRQEYFFNPNIPDQKRLDSNIVLIKLDGKNIYCDPGSLYTPFGLLPWEETGVQGLQLDRKEPVWIQSLDSKSDQAQTARHAVLTLTDSGDLEGKLTVTLNGLEAARIRRYERNSDDAERKKYLEETVQDSIPAACEVSLSNQPDWKNSESPLVVEFKLKVPGWASMAGRRVLIPTGLFGGQQKHLFEHADRVHPIYVRYPYQESDDVEIQLPDGWKIATLPAGWLDTGKVVTYTMTAKDEGGKLHLSRSIGVNFILLEAKYYGALRRYYQRIKATDDEQVVVEPAAAKAAN